MRILSSKFSLKTPTFTPCGCVSCTKIGGKTIIKHPLDVGEGVILIVLILFEDFVLKVFIFCPHFISRAYWRCSEFER